MRLSIFCLLIICTIGCSDDSDCGFLHVCDNGSCSHKDPWPPDISEIVGYLLLIIMSSAANAAGIGGSPIATPLFLLLFNFSVKEALPLSLTVVFGGSVATIALKLPLRHPERDRPLIDYRFVMHCQSTLFLGTIYGVLLYKIFPQWLILIIYSLFLCYLVYKTTKKGLKLYKNELAPNPEPIEHDFNEEIFISDDLEKIYKQEKRMIDWIAIMYILFIYAVVIIVSLLRGDKGVESIVGIELCSDEYWLLIAASSIIMILFSVLTGVYLVKKTKIYNGLDYNFDAKDIRWDTKKVTTTGYGSFFSGVIAGLLGMGGALLVNIIMLAYNIRPEIVAASTSFMILFSSSFGLVLYMIDGSLILEYALIVMCLSGIGSLIGVTVVKKMINRTGHSSIIVLILAAVLAVALTLLVSYGIYNQVTSNKLDDGFESPC